ncbi:Aste57867_23955 [Aphanomyces stellatus]|uniref:Aste57867_23955 protein n=1 Tax=Aphanomyces stellatus TaxID=120398 RepID=A0A485LPD9_9STRA|nr:hypothetical protein As57867_023882 [Aphanomyces stellatus]VFU00598.1 Aste57867_23955 [Aphanomyces stellatus]
MLRRCFSTASRGPKAVRRSAQNARRTTEKTPEDAIQTVQQPLSPAQYQPPPPQEFFQQPTFGQVMKTNFLWGAGMSLAFIFVGGIFRAFMEEAPKVNRHDEWEGAVLVSRKNYNDTTA